MTKVLVIYGYHPEEKFAIKVAKSLEKFSLNGVLVKEYEGKSDTSYKEPRLKRFLSRLYSLFEFDYAINLHNSKPDPKFYLEWKKQYPNERHPTIDLEHNSKEWQCCSHINKRIDDYCKKVQRKLLNKYPDGATEPSLIVTGHSGYFVEPKEDYDMISIEFYSPLISLEEAVAFLRGLIETLQS